MKTIDDLKVILKIHDSILGLEELNTLLKVSATSYWKKGDVIPNRNVNVIRKNTTWQLKFERDGLESHDTAEIIEEAITFIKARKRELNLISKNAELELVLVARLVSMANFGFFLDKSKINTLARMNIELDVDIYSLKE
jgi:hypothetical protein